ncbi:MAG: VOC family protein, partial [Acidimicrobiales bacterium]
MPTRLYCLVFDAADPSALATWWANALGWPITAESPDEVTIEPPAGGPGLPLIFVSVADPKRGKNRIHLDLNSRSAADQAAIVDRLTRLGAEPVDIGQGEVPWVVLADPEGNEFCV